MKTTAFPHTATTPSYQFYTTTDEAWEAMYQSLQNAQKTIFWEVFIFVADAVGERFIEVLCAKARAGLEVKIIFDAIGSFSFPDEAKARLEKAGVEVLFFNRLYPEWRLARWFSRLWFRNHRKVLIIDESTVFLGGVNISAAHHTWDDIYLKLTGTTARPLLRGFAKSYISSGGDRRKVRRLLHPRLSKDSWENFKHRLSFVAHSPVAGATTNKPYFTALAMAKESVNFLSPYFVPDRAFLKAITVAKKRGVKVNIFLPLRTDVKLMELISRAYYGLTLKAGANLYFLPDMHHGKALTVDNKAGLVGSMNLTPRSFYSSEESGLFFNDKSMVRDLTALFNNLKERATPFNSKAWQNRGWWKRFMEWLARWLERFV